MNVKNCYCTVLDPAMWQWGGTSRNPSSVRESTFGRIDVKKYSHVESLFFVVVGAV